MIKIKFNNYKSTIKFLSIKYIIFYNQKSLFNLLLFKYIKIVCNYCYTDFTNKLTIILLLNIYLHINKNPYKKY